MLNNNSYHLNALEKLVGCQVTGLVVSEEDEFGDSFFGISLKNAEGKEFYMFFLSDDEGNAPGSFEINEVKGVNP